MKKIAVLLLILVLCLTSCENPGDSNDLGLTDGDDIGTSDKGDNVADDTVDNVENPSNDTSEEDNAQDDDTTSDAPEDDLGDGAEENTPDDGDDVPPEEDDNVVGGDDEVDDDNTEDIETPTHADYIITVVDQGGNPISGVSVFICIPTTGLGYLPVDTDVDGVSAHENKLIDSYVAQVTIPEGYIYEGNAEAGTEVAGRPSIRIPFAEGKTTLTVVLNAEQVPPVEDPDEEEPGEEPSNEPVDYTICIKSVSGAPMSGITIYAYADEAMIDLRGFGVTDANGLVNISLPSGGTYKAVLRGAPKGYDVEENYTLSPDGISITLTSSVIMDQNIDGIYYELGDIIHDFTVVDCDGNKFQLSEVLKTKEMVLINFWYTTCYWCIKEFPYMQQVYEQYSDDVAIIALDPYASDSEEAIRAFRDEMGLTFPMAKNFTLLTEAFSDYIEGYPTSVIVDRYGMICMVECGGVVSAKPFQVLFEHFTGDNYEQQIIHNIDDLIPEELPDIDMPSSEAIGAAINQGDINITYSPETNPADAKYTWPFIIGEKEGRPCIYASNREKDGSFATIYANVEMEAGQALAFDYYTSTEKDVDVLYVFIDDKEIYQLSGVGSDWQTCYPWVAEEDGTYQLALCYIKDDADNVGDDTVYISNIRIEDVEDISTPTYIPRYAANDRAEDGFGYESYVEVFYNENDGYYHVGSENGPLLLAALMVGSRFSGTPIYDLAYNGKITIDGVNYYNELLEYFSYASNASLSGYCTVNQELKDLLVKVTQAVGMEQNQAVPNENEWLQMCSYYDVYGPNATAFPDPIAGLADFSAPDVILSDTGSTDFPNNVKYDRLIMPRGLYVRFNPTTSGVYRVVTNSDYATSARVSSLTDRNSTPMKMAQECGMTPTTVPSTSI